MTTTETRTTATITGYVTAARTLHAPVALLGTAPGGRLIVETLEGGVGGWSKAGKLLTVEASIFEQD